MYIEKELYIAMVKSGADPRLDKWIVNFEGIWVAPADENTTSLLQISGGYEDGHIVIAGHNHSQEPVWFITDP